LRNISAKAKTKAFCFNSILSVKDIHCTGIFFPVEGRKGPEILRIMYQNVDAVVDQPASTLWNCLLQQFPDAKVQILLMQ
jgi:hypothetical protein